MFIGKDQQRNGRAERLMTRILENQELLQKSQNFMKLQTSAQSSSHNENFVNTSKK